MKERTGKCEHTKAVPRPAAVCTPTADRQSSAGLDAWMAGEHREAYHDRPLTVDSGAAETVIPHLLVQDHAIKETNASRSGLNYAVSHRRPHPEPWGTKTAALNTRREFEGNDVSGSSSGSGTRFGKANVQLWTHGGFTTTTAPTR